ncbi:retrovirus-related pol polyprotein from transposon TNT 1-94 [Tanacetum coccineum]|uniref:Retrovirus-related pol polyprotein from transposon TNT 1-94 n=1 Tax=Tanacetum coccineum TaxID=301880 RepID=A0ABQ5DPU9_9ASTR
MMSFLSAVITSRYPTTNNQLRNSSNPRQHATINDGRVTLQPVQGRQISFATGTSKAYTPGASGRNSGEQRTVICYNCKGEGHMSKQCTKPKRKQDDSWFKDEVLLVQAQANGQILHEEELAFLADPGTAEDALAEVHNPDNVDNHMINQGVQMIPSFEQSNVMNYSETEITSDSNIIPYSQYVKESQQAAVQNSSSSAQQDALILSVIEQLKTQVINYTKINLDNKSVNDNLMAELERYKEQVKSLSKLHKSDDTCTKGLPKGFPTGTILAPKVSHKDDPCTFSKDNVSDSCEQSVEIDRLKQTLSEHVKEKESLMQTVTLLKNDFKKEESRNIDREIALEKKIKHLDNILEPKLYDGNVIKNTSAIVIPDPEETLMLAKESRSKMLLKQQDPMMLENKVNTTPVDYNSSDLTPSCRPTKVKVPKELPKVNMVNTSLKKLKHHIAGFDVVVKERTMATAITEGSWGFEHTKACFRDEIIPFVKALKDLFNTFDQYLIDELSEVQKVFHQMEQAVEQHRVKPSTSGSGSQPPGNTKKDKILRTPSSTQKNKVQAYPKTVKSSLKNKNFFVEPKGNANVQHSKLNTNSELLCVKCNVCMLSDNHDLCVLDFINDVNACNKSKSVKKSPKRKVWKPTGKVFTNIGYTWRPTSRTFTIAGNAYPLTRITTTAEVTLRKPSALENDTPKAVVTLVYSRKPKKSKTIIPVSKLKNIKSLSANKKEPSKSWGSIVFDVPSSYLDEYRSSKLFSEGVDSLNWISRNQCVYLSLEFMDGVLSYMSLSKASRLSLAMTPTPVSSELCAYNHLASHGWFEVDDYSRFTWVKCLRSKDEAPDFIIKFLKMIQTLRKYYEKVGISHETSVARSLQQNGVVKRRNSTLIEAARTIRIIKTIHVDFDELTVMASEHSSSGPALHEMTPATISLGLVPNPPPSTLFVPPLRTNWDLLFQPLFDELLTPPPSVDHPAPEVIAPIVEVVAPELVVSTGSPSSTTVDQDAPSPSNLQTTPETQSPIIPNDVEEENHDLDVAHMNNDPFFGIPRYWDMVFIRLGMFLRWAIL